MKNRFLKGSEIVQLGIVKPIYNEQIQPNSVELVIEEIYKIIFDEECDPPILGAILKNKTFFNTKCTKLIKLGTTIMNINNEEKEGYYLNKGIYKVILQEVKMPKNCFGELKHRSSAQRLAIEVFATKIDSGYHGKPEVTIVVNYPIFIEVYARLVHLTVYCSEEEFEEYKGQYQFERIEKK